MSTLVKVLAYITREREGRPQLLVFEQPEAPEAGWQVPGGTVELGEDLVDAVLREVYEESGLSRFSSVEKLADDFYLVESRQQWQHRHYYHLKVCGEISDYWEHRVTSGEEDAGLLFRYQWFPLEKLPRLAWEQDRYVHLVLRAKQ